MEFKSCETKDIRSKSMNITFWHLNLLTKNKKNKNRNYISLCIAENRHRLNKLFYSESMSIWILVFSIVPNIKLMTRNIIVNVKK